jgi:hypothetical protein
MDFRGHIQGGVVVLDEPAALPEGTPVTVRVEQAAATPAGQGLEKLAGLAELPADAAEKHDQYRRSRRAAG